MPKKTGNIFKNKRGFSLIELILVIAIIGIISTVSWRTLGGAREQSDATNACEQVASMINKTRNYALSGKMVGGAVPTSFSAQVAGSSVSIIGGVSTIETFAIPGGVNCGSGNFSFSVPAGSCTGRLSPSTITCTKGSASRTVRVYPTQAVCE